MSKRKNMLFACLLFISTSILILFLSELLLAIVHYPIVPLIRSANPAHYQIQRDNIEFNFKFSTNKMGIRYPDIPLSKAPNEKRVLLLGDSYTEGMGVEYEETYGAVLEKKFSKDGKMVRFINGGLTGAGPLEYAKLFYFVGTQYHPDVVLIVLYANDLTDTHVIPEKVLQNKKLWLEGNHHELVIQGFFHSVFPRLYTLIKAIKDRNERKQQIDLIKETRKFAQKKGISEEKINAWASKIPKDILKAANRRAFSAGLLTAGLIQPDMWVQNIDLEGDEVAEKWSTMVQILDAIIDLSREKTMKVGVVFAPSPLQYDKDYGNFQRSLGTVIKTEWADHETNIEKELQRWSQSKSVPFLNLTPYFRKLPLVEMKKMQYRLDGHWTPEGNKFVANILNDWLRRSKLVD